jgi:hypothetical protein
MAWQAVHVQGHVADPQIGRRLAQGDRSFCYKAGSQRREPRAKRIRAPLAVET